MNHMVGTVGGSPWQKTLPASAPQQTRGKLDPPLGYKLGLSEPTGGDHPGAFPVITMLITIRMSMVQSRLLEWTSQVLRQQVSLDLMASGTSIAGCRGVEKGKDCRR